MKFRKAAKRRDLSLRAHRSLRFEDLEGRRLLAAVYYVDSQAGNDANAGTSADAAWASLAKVRASALAPGDQVLLRRGSSWNEQLDVIRSGTASAPITFGAYGAGTDPLVYRVSITGSHTIVEDLIVDHGKQTGDALIIRGGKNVLLRDMELRNGAGDGVDVDSADGLVIDGLLIHHFIAGSFTNQLDAHGIVATDTNGITIRNTEVHHVSGDSFQADPDRNSTITTNVLIEDSHFWTGPLQANFNQWQAGQRPGENAIDTKVVMDNWEKVPRMKITVRDVVAHGWQRDNYISNKAVFNMKEQIEAVFEGVTVYDSEIAFRLRGTRGNANVTIENAVVYDVEKAFRAEDNLANLKIYNSTFGDDIGSQFQLAEFSSAPSTWDLRNNIYMVSKPQYATDPSNRIATAEDFVNSAARDYHLADSSDLVDAGVTIATVSADRDGKARPDGSAYDVGAYEGKSDNGPPPVPTDVKLQSFSADGGRFLVVRYDISGSNAQPFDIAVYRSDDGRYDTGDERLDTFRVSAASDLTIGAHTVRVPIGGRSGEVALPGAGARQTASDYYLLAVADPIDLVAETDANLNEDNVAAFAGVYHPAGGKIFVHGTSGADSLNVQTSQLAVTFNGTTYSYTDRVNTAVEARLYEGNDTATGGAGPDLLIGGLGDDILRGQAGNDTFFGNEGNDQLIGGANHDRYEFDTDTAQGSDTIQELTGEGIDSIDYTDTRSHSINLDLSRTDTQIVNANHRLTLSSGAAIENIFGGGRNDTLLGNALNNTLAGNAGDDVISGFAGIDVLTGNAGNDALAGGVGDDSYRFDADSQLGSDRITEGSNEGSDTLDFSLTTKLSTVIDLSLSTAQRVNQNLLLTIVNLNSVENVMGGQASDQIAGTSSINVLTSNGGNDVLDGRLGDDVYAFDADESQGNDTISDTSGNNWLDFSQMTRQGVNLDLNRSGTQVVNAFLSLTLPSGFRHVIGGMRNDVITGNSASNILIGNGGADTINGALGRDLLIGGSHADQLSGGAGEDILVGARTTYYNESSLRLQSAALESIFSEWQQSNIYSQRVEHLLNGGGLNGSALLQSRTVQNDNQADSLFGQEDVDWLLVHSNDSATAEQGEVKTRLS